MIIEHFTDNDLYKFSTMYAIQKMYPRAYVRYEFINRGRVAFPRGFDDILRKEVANMANLALTDKEKAFMRRKCYYFDPVFLDFLEGYRYDPDEVLIEQRGGKLKVEVEGYWYRTVLWEVPLLAMISELYYKTMGIQPQSFQERTLEKAFSLRQMEAVYSDFGTRRRFSFEVQDLVIEYLKLYSSEYFKGTSNVYLAMKHDTTPIGTMPHEWFMYHGAVNGYKAANATALEAWVDVYQGYLGTALSDTYTTDVFYDSFSVKQAKLFDGVRWDSGDPLEFADKTIDFYERNRINPQTKTIVFSDSLDISKVRAIKEHINGRIHDVYGIGTFFTNDVGVTPVSMVMKLNGVRNAHDMAFRPALKLTDIPEKSTGASKDVDLARRTLDLEV